MTCDQQKRSITAVNGRFDLTTLAGFDVTKSSKWVNGTVEGTTLIVPMDNNVMYSYDLGNGFTGEFLLKATVTTDPSVSDPPAAPTTAPTPAPSPTLKPNDPNASGFVQTDDGICLVDHGAVMESAQGLIADPNNPANWYYVANGRVQQVTSLVQYNGEWFYVSSGKLDTGKAGIVDYDGGRFFVAAGRLLREVTGLIMDPAGSGWYYCSAGQIHAGYTGLAYYDNAWFYVVNGKLDADFTGEVEYDGAKFMVVNGQMTGQVV